MSRTSAKKGMYWVQTMIGIDFIPAFYKTGMGGVKSLSKTAPTIKNNKVSFPTQSSNTSLFHYSM
jgi:hypothetical protein